MDITEKMIKGLVHGSVEVECEYKNDCRDFGDNNKVSVEKDDSGEITITFDSGEVFHVTVKKEKEIMNSTAHDLVEGR